MQNPLLEEVDEVTEQEDHRPRRTSPDEQNNEEAEDPAEEDPIDWSEYMQDGALDRTVRAAERDRASSSSRRCRSRAPRWPRACSSSSTS